MRAGFVHLLGKSNVGKSTFLNRIVGSKVSITSEKPNTTRHKVKGIYNRKDAQIVFLDTPGMHRAENSLGDYLVKQARQGLKGADLLLYMVEPWGEVTLDERDFLRNVANQKEDAILLVNKVDIYSPAEIAETLQAYQKEDIFQEYIPISALTGDGLSLVLDKVIDNLPEGRRLFSEEMSTDCPLGFLMSEFVREKVYELTYEELPYSVATKTKSYEARDEEDLVEVYVDIYVVRPSQKGIIIGKGGKKIKRIGQEARKEIEKLIGKKVYLDLKVKVAKNWNRKEEAVQSLVGLEGE